MHANRKENADPQAWYESPIMEKAMWLLIAAVAVAVSYPYVSEAWWRWDDTQILKQAASFSPAQYFFDPTVWRTLSSAHLTPWLTASFDLDHALFGLNPAGFYVHQVVSLILASVLLFETSRLWHSRSASLVATLVFLLSATVLLVSNQLMMRHYIEGLAFALAAVILFVRAERSSRPLYHVAGAAAYLLACASKELFVPLVGVLMFLPGVGLRQRAKALLPYLLVAALYIPWRIHMLGVAVGGYGADITAEGLLTFPTKALSYMFGPQIGLWLVGAVLLYALVVGMRKAPLFVFAFLVCIAVPLIPVTYLITDRVTDINTPRYLIVFVVSAALAIAFVIDHMAKYRTGRVLAALLSLALVVTTAMARNEASPAVVAQAKIQEVNGQFYWDHEGEIVFWVDLTGFHYYIAGLKWLNNNPGITVVTDEIELAAMNWQEREVWAYDGACACVRDITGDLPGMMAAWQGRVQQRPLDVDIRLTDDGVIAWVLGPYTEGRYYGINSQVFGTLPLKQEGGSRNALRKFPLVVRYDSVEGWVTYSDPLLVDLAAATEFSWSRQ